MGLFVAAVWDIGGAVVSVLPVTISGNCWRKLASISSPGFCELVLQGAKGIVSHEAIFVPQGGADARLDGRRKNEACKEGSIEGPDL